MKKYLLSLLLVCSAAFGQAQYPSPTYFNLKTIGTLTAAGPIAASGAVAISGTLSAAGGATVTNTFTATGLVTPADLATQAASTLLGNAANTTASPTAVSIPQCNTTNQALNWAPITGFTCQTIVAAGTGTVTSVASSGGTTGLTFTGSPITTSGTLTLGGTLAVASGGTGTTTSTGAGSVVLANGPTVTLANATGLPLTTGVTGTLPIANGGTGTTTATGTGSNVLQNSPSIVTPTITGGSVTSSTVDSTPIGATTPSTGAFTALTASTSATLPNLIGVTNASNAAAGSVGEIASSTGTAVSLTSATPANITSVSLTAGNWQCTASIEFDGGTGATFGLAIASISPTSATNLAAPFRQIFENAGLTNTPVASFAIPPITENVTTTTNIFLVGNASFSGGTMTATGQVKCIRYR